MVYSIVLNCRGYFEIFALLYHLVITRRVRIFFVKLKKQKAFFSNNVSLEARGT